MGCCEQTKESSASGYNWGEKTQYACGVFGAYVISFAIGGLRDVYVLMLGANVSTMAALNAIIVTWNVINELIISYMQDAELLNKCMDKKLWGRRAPWMATHIPLGFAAVVLAYCANVMKLDGNDGLYVLYFITTFTSVWTASAQFVSFSAAQIEMFPYKEERMEVEGIAVVFALAGVMVGVLGLSAAYLDYEGGMMLPIGCVCGFLSLSSLISLGPLRKAKAPADASKLGGFFAEYCSVFKNKAFLCYCSAQFFDGCYGAALSTFFVYYLTLQVEGGSSTRSSGLALSVFILLMGQVVMAPVWACTFNKKDINNTINIRTMTILTRLTGVFIPPLFIYSGDFCTTMGGWSLFLIVERLFYSCRAFWSTAARDWVVDEDIQESFRAGNKDVVHTKRREALYVGVGRLVQNAGTALASAFLFLAFSETGADFPSCQVFNTAPDGMDGLMEELGYTKIEDALNDNFPNFVPTCGDEAMDHAYAGVCCNRAIMLNDTDLARPLYQVPYETFTECCYEQSKNQPEATIDFVKAMYGVCMPVFSTLSLLFIMLFPIHGKRLAALYDDQDNMLAEIKKVEEANAPPAPVAAKAVESTLEGKKWPFTRAQLIAYYEKHDASKVATVDNIMKTWTPEELVPALTAKYGAAP
eukprot:g266.t1